MFGIYLLSWIFVIILRVNMFHGAFSEKQELIALPI